MATWTITQEMEHRELCMRKDGVIQFPRIPAADSRLITKHDLAGMMVKHVLDHMDDGDTLVVAYTQTHG